MTVPPAKASPGEPPVGVPVQGVSGVTQRALTPPPLPQQPPESPEPDPKSSSAAASAPADPSSAPTIRPPPSAAAPSSAASASSIERRGTGFTSVIRHLSLRGWLRWIHSNQCDAALRVRARDGGNGIIWCSAGTIVDAEWLAGSATGASPVIAEAAVQHMLRLGSGSVSIDFDPVDRAPRVSRPTHELLHPLQAAAGLGESRHATERHWSAGNMQEPASQPAPKSSADPQLESDAERPPPRWQQRLRWRQLSRGSYLLGGISFTALLLLAFIFGRSRGSNDGEFLVVGPPPSEGAQQTRSGLRPPPPAPPPRAAAPAATAGAASRARDLPVISFTEIQVEPRHAEIWLDQALVGVGRVELAAMQDGALHELRFVATGHAPRSLYFVDQPPAGRILLERVSAPGLEGDGAGFAPAELDARAELAAGDPASAEALSTSPVPAAATPPPARERETPRPVARRRAPVPRAAAEPAVAAKSPPPPVKKSPQIQLIDARVPRVQVLE